MITAMCNTPQNDQRAYILPSGHFGATAFQHSAAVTASAGMSPNKARALRRSGCTGLFCMAVAVVAGNDSLFFDFGAKGIKAF